VSNDISTSHYWQQRYQEGLTGWDIGYPSPPLTEYVIRCVPTDARILIPGAGFGHEAGALFRKGYYDVYICEYAEAAVREFLKKNPEFPKEKIFLCDFFSLDKEEFFDVILEQTFFCALLPERRKEYFQQCYRLLKRGGKLAGVLFSEHFDSPGPPFGGTPEEYQKLISPEQWNVLNWEACYNSIPPRKNREWWMELQKK